MTNSINSTFSGRMLASIMFLCFLALSLSPQLANAAGGDLDFSFSQRLCDIYNCFFGNNVVIFIGTVAIIFLGIGAFFGKLNWGLCIVVIIGIIIIGGAGKLAAFIANNDGEGCEETAATC